jgi:hypothetical protein
VADNRATDRPDSVAAVRRHSRALAHRSLTPSERLRSPALTTADRSSTAFLTGAVFRGELPILLVLHNENGDWQFLDGGNVAVDDSTAVHVAHMFHEHPELRSLEDLPLGWAAERSSETAQWERYPWPEDSE